MNVMNRVCISIKESKYLMSFTWSTFRRLFWWFVEGRKTHTECRELCVFSCGGVLAGDVIAPGDIICDIQTDKAVVGMEYDDEGILAKILVSQNSISSTEN